MTDNTEKPAPSMRERIAQKIHEHLAIAPTAFSLLQPCSVTVRNGHKFSKTSQIGGESFKPSSCYLGKKGQLIFVFKPMTASHFDAMEMGEMEAYSMFGSMFREHIGRADTVSLLHEVHEEEKAASALREIEQNKGKKDQYASIGWGDF